MLSAYQRVAPPALAFVGAKESEINPSELTSPVTVRAFGGALSTGMRRGTLYHNARMGRCGSRSRRPKIWHHPAGGRNRRNVIPAKAFTLGIIFQPEVTAFGGSAMTKKARERFGISNYHEFPATISRK